MSLLEAGSHGATPGKLVTGLSLVTGDEDFGPLQVFVRRVLSVLTALVLLGVVARYAGGPLWPVPALLALGLVAALVRTRGAEAPHDALCRTTVAFAFGAPRSNYAAAGSGRGWRTDVAMWLGITRPLQGPLPQAAPVDTARRSLALLDDMMIVGGWLLVVAVGAATLLRGRFEWPSDRAFVVLLGLAGLAAFVAILAGFDAWRSQASPGMRRLGFFVTGLRRSATHLCAGASTPAPVAGEPAVVARASSGRRKTTAARCSTTA